MKTSHWEGFQTGHNVVIYKKAVEIVEKHRRTPNDGFNYFCIIQTCTQWRAERSLPRPTGQSIYVISRKLSFLFISAFLRASVNYGTDRLDNHKVNSKWLYRSYRLKHFFRNEDRTISGVRTVILCKNCVDETNLWSDDQSIATKASKVNI